MSAIVKRLKSSSMEIYVKGAPDTMGEICDKDSCACLYTFTGISEDLTFGAPTSPA